MNVTICARVHVSSGAKISAVFPEVMSAEVIGSTNRELFATADPGMAERFRKNREKEKDPELSAMMEQVDAGLTKYISGNRTMTDDKAPVELLGMEVIDEIIRDEVAYYKRIYEEQGLEGLLNSI